MHYETAQSLYTQLEGLRWSFLDRGRTSSELTIPYVLPPEGHGAHTKYYTPYQGIGASGVQVVDGVVTAQLAVLSLGNRPIRA